jgi:hypothetical protein
LLLRHASSVGSNSGPNRVEHLTNGTPQQLVHKGCCGPWILFRLGEELKHFTDLGYLFVSGHTLAPRAFDGC